jgi:hypothetical protein
VIIGNNLGGSLSIAEPLLKAYLQTLRISEEKPLMVLTFSQDFYADQLGHRHQGAPAPTNREEAVYKALALSGGERLPVGAPSGAVVR